MKHAAATALGGIAYVVGACACFATLDTATKYVALTVPVLMALWVRYMMQALFSTALLLPLHGRKLLLSRHPSLQLLRGLLLVASTVMAFFSLRLLPVGEFTAIVMVTPMAVTVLAVTLLKERIAPVHWLFVFGGFVGTLVIIRPGGDGLGWTALFPLGCMATNCVFQLLTGHLSKFDSPATTHFYSVWVGAVLATLALPLSWTLVDSPLLWALMLFTGFMGALGHFSLALAYQRAPASTLMPYLYCHVGFAVFAGWLVFAHVPDGWSWLGMAMVAACGICSAWLTVREKGILAAMPET